jgi:hypothetical protein
MMLMRKKVSRKLSLAVGGRRERCGRMAACAVAVDHAAAVVDLV